MIAVATVGLTPEPLRHIAFVPDPVLIALSSLSFAGAVFCAHRSAKHYIGAGRAWRAFLPSFEMAKAREFSPVGRRWQVGFAVFLVAAVILLAEQIQYLSP